jgi:hypothetical protein
MNLKDFFRDIVRGVSGFKIDVVKVTATDTETKFEAVTSDRTLILKGSANTVVDDIKGTFGLSNLDILGGILNLTAMKDDVAVTTVKYDNAQEPEEITFKGKGAKAAYRLTAEKAVPKQPNFNASQFDVEVEPSKANTQELKELTSVFGAVAGNKFTPFTENAELKFTLGNSGTSNHNSEFTFCTIDNGNLPGNYKYPIDATLRALTLGDSSQKSTMKLTAKGAMVIEVQSGLCKFEYIFPGHSS